jgi:hypothetical protein
VDCEQLGEAIPLVIGRNRMHEFHCSRFRRRESAMLSQNYVICLVVVVVVLVVLVVVRFVIDGSNCRW